LCARRPIPRSRRQNAQQRIELHAAREPRELVRREQQRSADEARAPAEEARAERRRDPDEQNSRQRGRNAAR
jgi:hypothetical protein